MKLDFDRSLDLPVSADRAWAFLDRIEAVAGCLPGAAITEKIDDTHYRGTVSVRLGPVDLRFAGTAEVLARDPVERTLTLTGKGADRSGTSAAEVTLTAMVTEVGLEASRIGGKATVTVNGKAGALGARMMDSVSEQLISEFYNNLLEAVQADPAPTAQSVELSGLSDELTAPRRVATAPATSLNGFAFIWAVMRSFFTGLFTGKKAEP